MPEQAAPIGSEGRPIPFASRPGVQRDGTSFLAVHHTDAEWCRWNRLGKPKKMLGYRVVSDQISGPARSLSLNPRNNFSDVHLGHGAGVEYLQVAADGSPGTGVLNRTPSAFVSNPATIWQFDQIYDAIASPGTAAAKILALPALYRDTISDQTEFNLYYGDIFDGSTILTPTSAPPVSGGVCVFHPYVFVFGNYGRVDWSNPGLPDTWTSSDTVRIAAQKVVRGIPMRGGADNSPGGLFWTLNALVRCTFNGTAPTFRFDTVGTDITVMSPMAITSLDGVFYWLGDMDRFYTYNGVVAELPNTMNLETLKGRITRTARMRSYSFAVAAENEIWFVVPVDGSMEPNWAFIHNKGLGTWYDTPMPDAGRAAAVPSNVFPYPLLTGVDPNDLSKYRLWQHEAGRNRVVAGESLAIRSSFTTADLNVASTGPMFSGWMGDDRNISVTRLIPDFRQVGPMTVTGIARGYPQDTPIIISSTFQQDQSKDDNVRQQGRLIRHKFESNCLDGYYETGQPMWLFKPGDVRPTGT